jgi:hypothetical protein
MPSLAGVRQPADHVNPQVEQLHGLWSVGVQLLVQVVK